MLNVAISDISIGDASSTLGTTIRLMSLIARKTAFGSIRHCSPLIGGIKSTTLERQFSFPLSHARLICSAILPNSRKRRRGGIKALERTGIAQRPHELASADLVASLIIDGTTGLPPAVQRATLAKDFGQRLEGGAHVGRHLHRLVRYRDAKNSGPRLNALQAADDSREVPFLEIHAHKTSVGAVVGIQESQIDPAEIRPRRLPSS